jgi:zinc-ribbon domain
MKCFSCGEKLAKAARFCSNCGTNLRGVAVRPTTEIKTEVVTETDPEIEAEENTSTESLPFESLIIEKFNDPLPPLYLKQTFR